MPKLNTTDQAILMCQLAEHQDKLDEAVEAATIEYLRATEYLQKRLNTLRAAIDLRDSMAVVRKHVGDDHEPQKLCRSILDSCNRRSANPSMASCSHG